MGIKKRRESCVTYACPLDLNVAGVQREEGRAVIHLSARSECCFYSASTNFHEGKLNL